MQIPSKITFHNIDPSLALETRIMQKIHKLERQYAGLIGCHVIVDASHHKQKGNLYSVRIDLSLPGGRLAVSHQAGSRLEKHEKVYAAMNDAFRAIERQLLHYKQIQRNEVKEHPSILQKGEVAKLNAAKEFGFIELADGTEFYFHANSVHADRFNDLEIGSKVRFSFVEGEGTDGPQANLVRLKEGHSANIPHLKKRHHQRKW